MSGNGKSFMDRREEAEILTAQIKEIAPNVQSVSERAKASYQYGLLTYSRKKQSSGQSRSLIIYYSDATYSADRG